MTAFPAPVIIFGYNRPDHLQRTLETLSQATGANQAELWVFCDGPKEGKDPNPVKAVQKVAQDVRWQDQFAIVHVAIAEANKGLAQSIIGGVSTVLAARGRAIVLEDDLLVSSDFLTFMNACLEFYADDDRVGSVTGFCPLREIPVGYDHDVMAVPRNCSQGWATWQDRWETVKWDRTFAEKVWLDSHLRKRMNIAGEDRVARLQNQYRGVIDSWSIRFGAWQIATNRITIYPRENRIENIGYDGSGIHSGTGTPMNDRIADILRPPNIETVTEDPSILEAFRITYSGPLWRRLLRRLRLRLRGNLA